MLAVHDPGLHDLAALGHPAPIVLTREHPRSGAISYRLTPSALRRYPYVKVFLRCTVTLSPRTTHGGGYVEMVTGSGSSASAEFLAKRKRGRLAVDWNTVDVKGQTSHHTTDRTMRVDYPNYMLFDDARPGKRTLRFELTSYEGFRFERVTISPRSGIALTKKSPFPAQLKVTARPLARTSPRVGTPVTVAVRVANVGRTAVRDVPLSVATDAGARIVERGADHPMGLIPVGRAVERRMRVVARTAGRHVIRLAAGSGRERASGELSFAATSPPSGAGVPWLWIAIGGCAVGAAAWALRHSRAKRR
ncbi:MAG TPA: hypothetical protein VJT75_14765 [Thermoleophilaceae bacterium]|nr:hypothetical protein [Thermoleophilaceae bacterium]